MKILEIVMPHVVIYKYGRMYAILEKTTDTNWTLEATINNASLTLEQSWEKGARYLFCPTDMELTDTQYEALEHHFKEHRERLLSWTEDPLLAPTMWINTTAPKPSNKKYKIDDYQLNFSGCTFQNLENCSISCVIDEFCFQQEDISTNLCFEMEAVNLILNVNQFRISANKNDGGRFTFPILSNAFMDTRQISDLGKEQAVYTISLPNQDLEKNKGMIKQKPFYTEPCTLDPKFADIKKSIAGSLKSIRFTVFKTLENFQRLFLNGSIDPFHLFDANQSYINVLYNIDKSTGIPSNFITPTGDQINLLPLDDVRLVFEKHLLSSHEDENHQQTANSGLYLGLQGHFKIISSSGRLLCGLSGTEYAEFKDLEDPVIEFVAHQNSFVDLKEAENSENAISSLSTAPWIRLPAGVKYCDPPEVAQLYKPFTIPLESERSLVDDYYLEYVEFALSKFASRPPMVPIALYGSCNFTKEDFSYVEQFEQRLYQKRNSLLRNGSLPAAKEVASAEVCVTPQGLMVGVDEFGDWKWIGLGQQEQAQKRLQTKEKQPGVKECRLCAYKECIYNVFDDSPGPNDANAPSLRLEKLSPNMQEQLRQKDIFIVFESPHEFLRNAVPGSNFSFSIKEWEYQLHPNNWRTENQNSNTIMLLKYTESKSIQELMPDSPIVRQTLKEAYDEKGNIRKGFEEFIRIIHDPFYQGVLFLNVPLTCTDTSELSVLINDIDQSQLYARYLSLAANKFRKKADSNPDETNMEMMPSIVSSAAFYHKEQQLVYSNHAPLADYATKEMVLEVQKSMITNFSITAEFMLNNLFSVPAKGGEGNCFYIDGILQQKEGQDEYIFSIRKPTKFALQASAIEEVQVENVRLSVGTQNTSEPCTSSVFTLGGRLYFRKEESADLFSYGKEDTAEPEKMGLAFQGIQVTITKPDNAKNIQSAKEPEQAENLFGNKGGIADSPNAEVQIGYDSMVLYPDILSKPRTNSFGTRLPCKVDKLVIGLSGTTPESLGFGSITCNLKQGLLKEPWYGLIWKLDLGSMGALSNYQPISIDFFMGWSADENSQKPVYYIGIRLPGLGGKGFDIQGIIKLGFKSISLITKIKKDENSETEIVDYSLNLHSFALRFLGLPFPPGSNDIYLVGDQEGLGWYGCYQNEK